jgi:hypothetical protein
MYREKIIIKGRKTMAGILQQKPEEDGKDKERELLEEIISQNSMCRLEYGQGREIEYNIGCIKKKSVELLLQGKNKIGFEGAAKVHFQFINVGNLYDQVLYILHHSKQEKFPERKALSKKLKTR